MEYIDSFDLRELQIESALVISNHEATSSWIKKFSADHDSQQYYKNVIIWYYNEYGSMPSSDFPEDLDDVVAYP
jgi:hypothetical protein